jgi:hypothetical protein
MLCCAYLMAWYSKEQPAPFETTSLEGLQHLHGNVLSKRYQQDWLEDKKYPVLNFPSGVSRELQTKGVEDKPSVHIFGALSLPYHATRDQAYDLAKPIAQEHDFQLVRSGVENKLVIANAEGNRAYHLYYDNQRGYLADIVPYPQWTMELLDGESRAVLPPLYYNEKQGLNAIAPIKFFTPDSGWTWYPTEYDGRDLFFGLVSGFEVELGYFSLAELEAVRGPLGLPVERDLYYSPKSLKTLRQNHER